MVSYKAQACYCESNPEGDSCSSVGTEPGYEIWKYASGSDYTDLDTS